MEPLLIITYYWPPSGGAGVQRWLKMVKYLPEQGYQPIILTVDENYAAWPSRDESLLKDVAPETEVFRTRATNFYSFYQQFSGNRKIPQGGAPGGEKSFKKKVSLALRNHLFIPDPRIGWNKFALKKAKELIEARGIRKVITTSPPHSTQLIGMKLKQWKPDLQWVADLRDPWTDIYYYKDLDHSRWSDRQNRQLEVKVLEEADQVITVNETLRQLFLKKSPRLDPDRFHIVTNGFDAPDFEGVHKTPNAKFTIVYTGTADKNYDFRAMVKAMSTLPKDKFGFKIIGSFKPEAEAFIRDSPIGPQTEFLGYLPHDEALKHTFSADLLLLVIPRVADNELITTGKVFEYMASGNPILAVGPENNEAGKILAGTGAGQMFAYEDEEGVKGYLLGVFQGENEFVTDPKAIGKFTRESLAGEVAGILEK